MTPAEREACEAYLRRNGLPHLTVDYDPREDTLTRLRPALVLILIVGLAVALRPDWPVWKRGAAVLLGLAIAAAAIILVNVARGRSWRARPQRVGFVEAVALVLVPPVAALVLGDGLGSALVIGGWSIAIAAVLYATASFGVLPLLVHQGRAAVADAVTTVAVAVRAMAIMFALLVFLILAEETWRALGGLEGWRFVTVMILFGVLVVVMLLGGLRRERARLVEPVPDAEMAARARTTPAAPLVGDAIPPRPPRLGRVARLNVTLALLLSLGLRVVAVGAAVGVILLVFEVLIVDRELTTAWVGGDPHIYLAVDVAGGGQIILSEAAVRVAALLGGFAAVYFTSIAVGDPSNRDEFLGDELERLRRVIATWVWYRAAATDGSAGSDVPHPPQGG